MTDAVVTILAILSGFIPAVLLDGFMVSIIGAGVAKKNYGNQKTVTKMTGVFLILVEFGIGAAVGYYANEFFEDVFTASGNKVWLYFGIVGFFLILGARARIGGKWGIKESTFLGLFFVVSVLVLYFGFGGGTTSGVSSP